MKSRWLIAWMTLMLACIACGGASIAVVGEQVETARAVLVAVCTDESEKCETARDLVNAAIIAYNLALIAEQRGDDDAATRAAQAMLVIDQALIALQAVRP